MPENDHIFDKHPGIFRLAFLCLTLPILTLAVSNTYYVINRGSPENYYQASPSRLYVREDINRVSMLTREGNYFFFGKREASRILAGDLVVAVNDQPTTSLAELQAYLEDHPDDEKIDVEIQRTTGMDYRLSYRLAVRDLLEKLDETPPTVYVWHVARGGASYRAGIRTGDLIFEINGETFTTKAEADRHVAQTLHGQEVHFGILRKGHLFEAAVIMARITIPISLIFYVAVGFLWAGLGLFFGLFRTQLKSARILSLGFILIGSSLLLYEGEAGLQVQIAPYLGPLSFFMGIAALINLSYYFPREQPRLLLVPIYRFHGYLLALPAMLMTVMLGAPGVGLGLLAMLTPQLVIRKRPVYRRSRERALMEAWLMNGITFGLVALFTWSLFSARMTFSWNLTVRGVAALMVLGSYVGTIARYRLLGVEIRRGMQYSFAIFCWWALLLFSLIHTMEWLSTTHINLLNVKLTPGDIEIHDRAYSPEEQLRRHKVTLMMLTLLIGTGLWRLGLWGRQFLRRKFHRESYDFLFASDELKHSFNAGLGLPGMAEAIALNLRRLMLLKGVVVIFFEDESRVLAHSSSGGEDMEKLAEVYCTYSDRLAAAIKPFRAELSTEFLSPELRAAFNARGMHYLCPIHTKNSLLGCIVSGEKLSESTYGPNDFRFLAATASQASTAVENTLLYQQLSHQERLRHELELARQIQLASLPQGEPHIEGLDISGASLPALEVGGDYYAYFPEGEAQLMILVADVSGKGTSAALYMSKMQGIFAALHDGKIGPRDLFLKANAVLYREMDKSAFITALGARFCTKQRRVEFARAGHLPMVLYSKKTGQSSALNASGLGLGLENKGVMEKVLEQASCTYDVGDIFLLFSDGISEMLDVNQELFGEARVLSLLEEHADKSARNIRDIILAEVNSFGSRDALGDDQTLVVVKAR